MMKEAPLNIVVCVKQTPDTAATVRVQESEVSWGDAPLVLNPWDEYAVEEALKIKEAHGGKVTAITLGIEQAKEALKQALAMGCDEAILISDPAFDQADSLIVAKALSAGIKKLDAVDLIFCGKQAVDSDLGLLGSQIARVLGYPSLSLVAAISEIDPGGGSIVVERMLEEGRQEVRSPIPAVVSVVKEINEPRYPSFMGIRKASKAEIPTWALDDLGTGELPEPVTMLVEVFEPPKIDTTCEFIEADSPEATAAQLVDRLMEEKVL